MITFDKSGGTLVARVSSAFAQPGSYALQLWEKDKGTVVLRRHGDFIKSADDDYDLPAPNEANDGRFIQCIATIAIVPPVNKYQVTLTVLQDDQALGSVSMAQQSDDVRVTVNLVALLKQAEDQPA